MNKPHTCLVCDKGTLTEKTHSNYFQHGNHSITVNELEGYLCDFCHVDLISPSQLRRNHVKIVDAKRKHDGLLTGDEIKAIRKKLQSPNSITDEVSQDEKFCHCRRTVSTNAHGQSADCY